MFLLLFFVISFTFAHDISKKNYFSIQKEVLILGSKEGVLSLISGENDWPSFIYYSQDINNTTGIDVSLEFNEANNSKNLNHPLIRRMDICVVLHDAITKPQSPQAQFMIPEMMGLYGIKCPITKGIRNLNPYNFPTLSAINDIGTGMKNLIVRIEDRNSSNAPLITLIAPLNMKYWNEETQQAAESSSAIFPPHLLKIYIIIGTYLLTK